MTTGRGQGTAGGERGHQDPRPGDPRCVPVISGVPRCVTPTLCLGYDQGEVGQVSPGVYPGVTPMTWVYPGVTSCAQLCPGVPRYLRCAQVYTLCLCHKQGKVGQVPPGVYPSVTKHVPRCIPHVPGVSPGVTHTLCLCHEQGEVGQVAAGMYPSVPSYLSCPHMSPCVPRCVLRYVRRCPQV